MENVIQKSDHFPECFYRVTVKGLIVVDGRVLLMKEVDKKSGKWELPGGGLDFGEEIHEALKREIQEEMGVKVKKIDERPLYVWTWKFQNSRQMDWFYSFVVAYKIEVESLDFETTEDCQEIGWFSEEELQLADLNKQTNGLKKLFSGKDFAG